jgi:hypothetical protein
MRNEEKRRTRPGRLRTVSIGTLIMVGSALSCSRGADDKTSASAPVAGPASQDSSAPSPSFSEGDQCWAYVELWVIQMGTGARNPYDVYYELGQTDPMTDFILAMWREDLRNRASYGVSEGSRRTQAAITEGCDGRYLRAFRQDVNSGKIIPTG